MIKNIAESQKISHRLLEKNENPKSSLYVVIASDRGLCGSFNSNIAKFTEQLIAEKKTGDRKTDFIFIGRRLKEYFSRRNVEPVEFITGLDKDISYSLAARVAKRIIKAFETDGYEEIQIVYNEFKSAISQNVICERLLPVENQKSVGFEENRNQVFSKDILFEPDPEKIIDQLLQKHFATQVYRCMSESVASEHGARMTSMENSTKNAGELIKTLTITYNKLRQASITKELIEITTGAEALNG